jgi:hypothetical protein
MSAEENKAVVRRLIEEASTEGTWMQLTNCWLPTETTSAVRAVSLAKKPEGTSR